MKPVMIILTLASCTSWANPVYLTDTPKGMNAIEALTLLIERKKTHVFRCQAVLLSEKGTFKVVK